MKPFQRLAICAALTVASVGAIAAQAVTVTNLPLPVAGAVSATVSNTAANPLPVTVMNAQTIVPYQATASTNSSTCPSQQCSFTFTAVPAGKRLVLQSVTGQVGSVGATAVLFERAGGTYFVAIPSTAQGTITQPVTLYFEPGENPSARMFAQNNTYSTSLIITIVGMLVPAN